MQIKKEDIKQTIVESAREEFLLHGYESASMRTIAKKANTSLGNIYHYFPNKKAILDTLLQPIVKTILAFMHGHMKEEMPIMDMEQISVLLENVDFESVEMKALMSKEFVIFMETKEEEYRALRELFLADFEQHVAWHMHMQNSNHHFVKIATKMLIDCVLHINRCVECAANKKEDMIKMFKILCRSVAGEEFPQEISKEESEHKTQ